MTIFLLVLGLLLFVGLILVHEWGHFVAARLGGVTVEEYGVFFPPRLYKKRMKGGWDFTINLLPLGGFVKLKGEHDADTAKGSFGAASLGAKSLIMAAGVLMNLVVAFLLFMILAWWGMPQLVSNQFTVASDTHYVSHATYTTVVDEVVQGSPAAKAGVQKGDEIVSLAGQSLSNDLSNITKKYAGKTVVVRYKHTGIVMAKQVQLNTTGPGYLGVATDISQQGMTVTRSTWSAPAVAAGVIGQFTALTFQGLGHALAGLGGTFAGAVTHNHAAREAAQTEASNQVSGPIGVYFVFKYGAALGLQFIVMVVALLSLTLAIMNVLPIPALDGFRLWSTLVARALKKPFTPRAEELTNAVGFVVLIGLMIVISVVDVRRFF